MPRMDDNPFSAPQTRTPEAPESEPAKRDRYWFMRPGHPGVLSIMVGLTVLLFVGLRFGERAALLTLALWMAVIVAAAVAIRRG
jgi:hypothetical protein